MFRKIAWVIAAAVVCALVAPSRGEVVSETFGPAGKTHSTHPGKLTITGTKAGSVVAVDISSLPAGAKIYRASLIALRGGKGLEDRQSQWLRPVRVYALAPGEEAPPENAEPLEFEPPWYRSFDVTSPVGRAVADKAGAVKFFVAEFYQWRPDQMELRITGEGPASQVSPQVTGVRAFHADGSTFVTWKEM
ncbi:MAG: hypothetical protein AMJ81_09420, partial [Phycisphaerae bacterium SM23_33]